MKRSSMKSRYRSTGPSPEVVRVVAKRDEGRCAVCGERVTGTRGLDHSVHHRLGRKRGGTQRPWVNFPSNLILLCGHGSAGCHLKVGTEGWWARDNGFVVREGRWLPTQVLVEHAVHGPVYLLDDGGISHEPPGVAA